MCFVRVDAADLTRDMSVRLGTGEASGATGEPYRGAGAGSDADGYVARDESSKGVLSALSMRLGKAVVASNAAMAKRISGQFNLDDPRKALDRIAADLGLIWYSDGHAIYVYDAFETKSNVFSMQNTTLAKLRDFLRGAGLYDRRYPLRGHDGDYVFYLSGPPLLVDLAVTSAQFLDRSSPDRVMGNMEIGVVRLENTFVDDRQYTLRDNRSTVPGMASVIQRIMGRQNVNLQSDNARSSTHENDAARPEQLLQQFPPLPELSQLSQLSQPTTSLPFVAPTGAQQSQKVEPVMVLSYPETNSLLIKGTPAQVEFVKRLIAKLDVPKRHIELSLWIIDMQEDQLNQLGIKWNSNVKYGIKLSSPFKTLMTAMDSDSFIATIQAMDAHGKGRIVSRPVILTQENTRAFFDHNRTFYVKLQGERTVQLEHVTYGTLIEVLPRFSSNGEIEMSLDIEDGNELSSNQSGNSDITELLPEVARTHINTVARVPKGKSLLIGGYTRDEDNNRVEKVPFLGDLPVIGSLFRSRTKIVSNTIRVFLIQPKFTDEPPVRDASDLINDLSNDLRLGAPPEIRRYLERQNGH